MTMTLDGVDALQPDVGMPFPGEVLREVDSVPALVRCRLGTAGKPLVVFLTGGGHLARVVYGHPGSEPRDFLDHWLAAHGIGLLAVSYPSDHPVFSRAMPDLTLGGWAIRLAALAEEAARKQNADSVIACGWSMGGRIAFAFTRELRRSGIRPHFVSLAATPPFLGFSGRAPRSERLTRDGLWDLSPALPKGRLLHDRWLAELAAAAQALGRSIISPADYERHYRANTPVGLWGPELEPIFVGTEPSDISAALAEASSASYEDFPLCAAIVPTDAGDGLHVLGDQAIWGFATIQGLLRGRLSERRFAILPAARWHDLQRLCVTLPQRLTRSVRGGHLFFVGETGAAATAEHLLELIGALDAIDREVAVFAE
jgi:hypothetical protein